VVEAAFSRSNLGMPLTA